MRRVLVQGLHLQRVPEEITHISPHLAGHRQSASRRGDALFLSTVTWPSHRHFFHRTLAELPLCPKFYTPEEDGLAQTWRGERVFMNPPYGRGIGQWIAKAYLEAQKGALVVALVPARTDTAWWQNYVIGKASICYLSGRLKFGNSKQSAPFPSAILVYWGGY